MYHRKAIKELVDFISNRDGIADKGRLAAQVQQEFCLKKSAAYFMETILPSDSVRLHPEASAIPFYRYPHSLSTISSRSSSVSLPRQKTIYYWQIRLF